MSYELVEHTADVAIRVRGAELGSLYVNLAFAVADQLADARRVGRGARVPVQLTAQDAETLAVALANEIIFRRDAEGLLLPWLELDAASGTLLSGVLSGEPADPRHDLRAGLKAATYHQLAMTRTPDGVELFMVFDV